VAVVAALAAAAAADNLISGVKIDWETLMT